MTYKRIPSVGEGGVFRTERCKRRGHDRFHPAMAVANRSKATTIMMGVVEPGSEKRGNSCDRLSAFREFSIAKPFSRVVKKDYLLRLSLV